MEKGQRRTMIPLPLFRSDVYIITTFNVLFFSNETRCVVDAHCKSKKTCNRCFSPLRSLEGREREKEIDWVMWTSISSRKSPHNVFETKTESAMWKKLCFSSFAGHRSKEERKSCCCMSRERGRKGRFLPSIISNTNNHWYYSLIAKSERKREDVYWPKIR